MATYYVSGVWKNVNNVITHLYVHPVNGTTLLHGVKNTEAEVINLINNGHVLNTMRWNYQTAQWAMGAKIIVVVDRSSSRSFVRTVPDAQVIDNLDNIINLAVIV